MNPFSRHSAITRSMKSRPTGRSTGPMANTRPHFCPWSVVTPVMGSHLYACMMSEWKSLVFCSRRDCFSFARRDSMLCHAGFISASSLSEILNQVQDDEAERNALRSYRPRLSISNALQSLPASFICLWTPIIRLRVVCMPNFPISDPIHLRPSFSATASVVPDPQKKSATRSQEFEEDSIIL